MTQTYDAHDDPQHIGPVFVNPGSGPVNGATLKNARANIAAFADEIGVNVEIIDGPTTTTHDGRYCFQLQGDEASTEIDMPGLPLEQVRYTRAPGQNIWHFPRLYVDGSSWVWHYAINQAREAITGEESA